MSTVKRWTGPVRDKACAYQLATELAKLCSAYYPFLLSDLHRVLERLQPVRLSPCGRKLRAWGRDYLFTDEEAVYVHHLVDQYRAGTKVVPLPEDTLADHRIRIEGILSSDGHGMFWLEEPADEKAKPPLVVFPTNLPAPKSLRKQLSKEALALAALADHPDWSDEQIAALAGCNRSSLYRMHRFQRAREALYGGRNRFRRTI